MNRKTALQTLARAEKAGLKIVVDADEWTRDYPYHSTTSREFPLDLSISPNRCELVAEARRLADAVASRPAKPPEGQVYRHSAKDLDAALARAARRIAKELKENPEDEKPDDDPASGGEQPARDGAAARAEDPPRGRA